MLKQIELVFRRYFPKRATGYKEIRKHLHGLSGIEIGGPSDVFDSKGLLPLYDCIKSLDGVNFSTNTIWEGNIKEGISYRYGNKTGYQYILDSVDLSSVETGKYNFLLSCHSIEHLANPIKAINDWKRVVKDGGYLLFVIPHKDKTFDHKRTVTTLKHVINDYEIGVTEDDITHFEEVISLHDIAKDPGVDTLEQFTKRTYANLENRSVHHHVFNTLFTVQFLTHMQLQVVQLIVTGHHIIVLTQKTIGVDNSAFLSSDHVVYSNPAYPSDYMRKA